MNEKIWVDPYNTKKQGLKVWAIFLGLIFALTLIQSATGRLEGMLRIGWIWMFSNLLPGFILLLVLVFIDPLPTGRIPSVYHKTLVITTWFYLLLVLLTLLLEPIAIQGQLSIAQYRLQSFIWTLPVQLLLLGAYSLVSFGQNPYHKREEQQIIEIAKEEQYKWKDLEDPIRQKAFDHIMAADIASTFKLLDQYTDVLKGKALQHYKMQKAAYVELKKNEVRDLLSYETLRITKNKIIWELIELLSVE